MTTLGAPPAPTGAAGGTLRLRTLRLRTRVTLLFSMIGLLTSLGLAVVTYALARGYLIDQRLQVARTETFANAKTVRDQLLAQQQIDPVRDLRTEGGGFALIVHGDRRFYSDVRYTLDDIPIELRTVIDQGGSGQQRFTLAGTPMVAVGITLPAVGAEYIEAFPLSSTERNLRAIVTALVVGAGVTTLVAGGLGWWTGRRLLAPLYRVSTAAGEIASGGLDARMPPEDDPDLARLARSFNDMADAVQARIEREARFASDVSHELRSPITALAAAVEVLDSRRGELPDRSQQALDVVVSQVRRFDHMVMDLLELSRIDAGSTELHREDVNLSDLVPRIAQRYGFSTVPVDCDNGVPSTIRLDKLRFERVLANLLENAREHAGGPIRIGLEMQTRSTLILSIDDAGPGVARGERQRIFERFARGSAARHRVGTGLGLALVTEHAHAHGGDAWVEDRPGGGARFKVSFTGVS